MAEMMPHQFLSQSQGTRIVEILALECLSHHVIRSYTLKPTYCVEAQTTSCVVLGIQNHWSVAQLRSQLTLSNNLPAMWLNYYGGWFSSSGDPPPLILQGQTNFPSHAQIAESWTIEMIYVFWGGLLSSNR